MMEEMLVRAIRVYKRFPPTAPEDRAQLTLATSKLEELFKTDAAASRREAAGTLPRAASPGERQSSFLSEKHLVIHEKVQSRPNREQPGKLETARRSNSWLGTRLDPG